MKSSEEGRFGAIAFTILAIYVLILGFATVDDLLGWGVLRPLFTG